MERLLCPKGKKTASVPSLARPCLKYNRTARSLCDHCVMNKRVLCKKPYWKSNCFHLQKNVKWGTTVLYSATYAGTVYILVQQFCCVFCFCVLFFVFFFPSHLLSLPHFSSFLPFVTQVNHWVTFVMGIPPPLSPRRCTIVVLALNHRHNLKSRDG